MRSSSPTASPAPLLLTAGEGPWLWRVVRYGLLAGALDSHVTLFPRSAVSQLRSLGTIVSTAHGEWPRSTYSDAAQTFSFDDGEPDLTLALTEFDDAGVGHQVWPSAIAMAMFMRSSDAPTLPKGPRVLELGAGVGLPGCVSRLHLSRTPRGTARGTPRGTRRARPREERRCGLSSTYLDCTALRGMYAHKVPARRSMHSPGRVRRGHVHAHRAG